MAISHEQIYPATKLFIDGCWREGMAGGDEQVLNPATGEPIGTVSHASRRDLDCALESAVREFEIWRRTDLRSVQAYARGCRQPS